MATPRVLVLRAAGINCDEETAFGWQRAGALTERVHVNRIMGRPDRLKAYQILTIPGGFSYGDDIAAGAILGNQLARHLGEAIGEFVEGGGLVLGICNGFQVLVRAGLLPGPDCPVRITLALNESGRYEDHWVRLRAEAPQCAFLPPGETFEMPVGHAEGRVAFSDESALAVLESSNRVALRYVASDDGAPSYPQNPNGSTGNVAGLTDGTGRILGLMPHPDRFLNRTNHPAWTRDASIESDGLRFFRHAISYFQ